MLLDPIGGSMCLSASFIGAMAIPSGTAGQRQTVLRGGITSSRQTSRRVSPWATRWQIVSACEIP